MGNVKMIWQTHAIGMWQFSLWISRIDESRMTHAKNEWFHSKDDRFKDVMQRHLPATPFYFRNLCRFLFLTRLKTCARADWLKTHAERREQQRNAVQERTEQKKNDRMTHSVCHDDPKKKRMRSEEFFSSSLIRSFDEEENEMEMSWRQKKRWKERKWLCYARSFISVECIRFKSWIFKTGSVANSKQDFCSFSIVMFSFEFELCAGTEKTRNNQNNSNVRRVRTAWIWHICTTTNATPKLYISSQLIALDTNTREHRQNECVAASSVHCLCRRVHTYTHESKGQQKIKRNNGAGWEAFTHVI